MLGFAQTVKGRLTGLPAGRRTNPCGRRTTYPSISTSGPSFLDKSASAAHSGPPSGGASSGVCSTWVDRFGWGAKPGWLVDPETFVVGGIVGSDWRFTANFSAFRTGEGLAPIDSKKEIVSEIPAM